MIVKQTRIIVDLGEVSQLWLVCQMKYNNKPCSVEALTGSFKKGKGRARCANHIP